MDPCPAPLPTRRTAIAALAAVALGALAPVARAQSRTAPPDQPDASERWQAIRRDVFGNRPLRTAGADELVIEAPTRADDAAVVPIAIRVRAPQTAQRHVSKVYLVIDNNPSPLGAVFHFTPDSGRAEIETRVRIDDYTHVRAIAEMNDGALVMAVRHVKASGGCSAPPGKDAAAALATLGRMRLQVVGTPQRDQPTLAQLMVSHPNHSGLAMDQLTRHYTPARFVRRIDVSYAGKPVLGADVDFTISENPNLRFYFVPHGSGELRAEIVDTDGARFATALAVGDPR